MITNFEIPSTLSKSVASSGDWVVGGVASSFHRDLDGEAITPDAVRQAIPEFMAPRGMDGIKGGEIRLHHNFWNDFLKQAIARLNLPRDEQMSMIAAIALPLGRVTKMWVDETGKTHWRGVLSKANPISKIIWQMLQEKLIALGVSLGGKIYGTRMNGRDALGRLCNLITAIRIDELSITSNPALRLTQGEDTGAYITALAKSVKRAGFHPTSKRLEPPRMTNSKQVQRFLKKAVGSDLPSMGMSRDLGQPKSSTPKGSNTVNMDAKPLNPGVAGKQFKLEKPKGSSANEPSTDVWGMTVGQFTRSLSKMACKANPVTGKATDMKKAMLLCKPGLPENLMSGAYGLTMAADTPPAELVNFVRFLQKLAMCCSHLPGMSDWEREGAVSAMSTDLYKSLEEFEEKMPAEIKAKPLRPPGSGVPMPKPQEIAFPQQYAMPTY